MKRKVPPTSEPRAPEVTSRIMSAVKNRNSKAELLLRRALFARGLRYRVHARKLVGNPDIVFPGARVALFVDGDFWHGNAWRLRGMASFDEQFHFKSNPEFWRAKITRNMARDAEVNERLAAEGWHVVRLWESEVLKDVESCVAHVARIVAECRSRGTPITRDDNGTVGGEDDQTLQ